MEETSNGRLILWKLGSNPDIGYCAGSQEFANDVLALMKEANRLRSENEKLAAAQEKAAKWERVFGHLGTADECGNEWIALQDELAAAQATIAEMAALAAQAKNAVMVVSSGCSHIKAQAECNEARQFAAASKINVETALAAINEALALPTNQDALHEALARELEEQADWFENRIKYGSGGPYDAEWVILRKEAAAHRARKEEK